LGFVFDEQTFLDQNLFKFESRLKSSTSRFIAEGAVLTTYFNLAENRTTVDRGLQTIDQLFGKNSPLRFNKVKNFPLYSFAQMNPANDDSAQVEDIGADGECVLLPCTVVPHQNDFFILNHLKMKALFRVTEVQFDSMKVNGYYKIKYHLYSNSDETIAQLEKQTVNTYNTDLNAIGTEVNPIIREDDFVLRSKIRQLVVKMIESYKALFYNTRHNCFLYMDPQTRLRWFDVCGAEFISKHNLMNSNNSSNVIILDDKLRDENFPLYYNNSVYNWIEVGCPPSLLSQFFFTFNHACNYLVSSFAQWSERDVRVIIPQKSIGEHNVVFDNSFFDKTQVNSYRGNLMPASEIEKLLWKFFKGSSLTIKDIPLSLGDPLLLSISHRDLFFYVPVLLYIIKLVLRMN